MFDDGPELFDAICGIGVEGVVGKRLDEPYKPGERAWLKVKNRGYWRYPHEMAAIREDRSRPHRDSELSASPYRHHERPADA
jgi:ATP-dependent DNA ligase